jgi:hypothetical protein
MEKDLMYISFLKFQETEHLGQMISAPASKQGSRLAIMTQVFHCCFSGPSPGKCWDRTLN